MGFKLVGGSPHKKRNRMLYSEVIDRGTTLKVTADKYNISANRIRQIIIRSGKKLYGKFLTIRELRAFNNKGMKGE